MAKKLLNEATIRRFQTLAKVAPINEMYHKRDEEEKMEEVKHDDDKMEEGMYEAEEEVMKEEEDMDMDAEAPEMEMDGDLELTDDEAEAIIALGKKLEAAMGDEEPEMDMEMDAGEEDMGDMDMEDEEEEMMETMLEGINYQPSKSEVINEVAKRVARASAEVDVEEALDNAKQVDADISNNNEALASQEENLVDKFKKAFSRENIEIS